MVPLNTEPEKSKSFEHHISRDERYNNGKQLRVRCPRSSHAQWEPVANRRDPLDLLLESEKGRIEQLLPLRHGRMARSPFTFYRGSAFNMAADLVNTPVSGMIVQACGDAHLCNFGGFATPERNVIFSINDLDETLPAPWEWDVKRLATSFVIACRTNKLNDKIARESVLEVVRSYRDSMDVFSKMKTIELWHFSLGADMTLSKIKDPKILTHAKKRLEKERGRSLAEEIFPEIDRISGKRPVIKDKLPSIFHFEGKNPEEFQELVREAFNLYRESLNPAFRSLLDRFELFDVAIKVVGVGSVGTSCWVFLFITGDGEPFFLQVKEARASVLEPYAGKSIYQNHGQRVINGYHFIQPFSDPFLGWTESREGRHFYFRQLRDIKISMRVETFGKVEMISYADWCGQAMALSHARSGDAAMLSGYMGTSDKFDQAIADFSFKYAEQNDKDYAAMIKAIKDGRIDAEYEE
jgi:uncharacterized protein (DUF2252 family)